MKTNIDILREVEKELERFKTKLDKAIVEQSDPPSHANRHYAAAKRSAIDLKNELTKLTQDSKYKCSSYKSSQPFR